MGRPHISARSKKPQYKHDVKMQRQRALWHYQKESKAEKNFWYLYENEKKAKEQGKQISKKDIAFVNALSDQYYTLQLQIESNNTDDQRRYVLVQQQHDILDELEKVYTKYLSNGDNGTKMHNK